ncbi:hypothetical protein [Acaryochloris sp. IP29b_bin.137]|uniref:hypothetical protein n=1 Tax=Acaryochloris sp. IP29b_bin.137 TaxID=2969217 RepID=UPI00262F499F|nr:hypothetical protein [Acaryochloris sp. IP29b_bin.137]
MRVYGCVWVGVGVVTVLVSGVIPGSAEQESTDMSGMMSLVVRGACSGVPYAQVEG